MMGMMSTMRVIGVLSAVGVMCVACGGGSTSPSPLSSDQEVRLAFVIQKAEWYDCGIAVEGSHSRTITISVNNKVVGNLQGRVPYKTERLAMIVRPGRYSYKAVGEDYKYRPLVWSGTALANYPLGATIYLVCVDE